MPETAAPHDRQDRHVHGYLVSYDIHDTRALRRLHRHLQTCATALLESLFLFQGNAEELHTLTQTITHLVPRNGGSVAIYRIRPGTLRYLCGGLQSEGLLLHGDVWAPVSACTPPAPASQAQIRK